MENTLETYEWNNTWIEKTDDKDAKRVLYIGDSISCGTRFELNSISKGKILFDGFGSSKALDNPYYFPELSLWAKQEEFRNAVLFNNGLHGWHIGEQEYSRLYDEFLDKLINEFPDTVIIPILTTSVTNPDYHNDRVTDRNAIVRKLAESKGLPIIDLYTVSEQNRNLQSEDGVHFTRPGYIALANALVKEMNRYL